MASVTPGKFLAQVKQESAKVTWPTRKETMVSTVVVLVMAVIAAIFFLFVDWGISSIVQAILGL